MPSKQSGSALVLILVIAAVVGGLFFSYKFLGNSGYFGETVTQGGAMMTQELTPSLSLSIGDGASFDQLKKGDVFTVNVLVSTEEPVNIISTKITYPKEVKFKQAVDLGAGQPITMWVSQKDFPQEGFYQLIGGVPTTGVKTAKDEKVLIAKLEFEAVSALSDSSAILPTEVEMLSSLSNQPLEGVKVEGINGSSQVLAVETSRTASMSLTPTVINTAPGCSFDITANYDASDYPYAGNEWSLGMSFYLNVDESKFSFVSSAKPENFGDGYVASAGVSNTSTGPEKDTIVVNYLQSATSPTGGSPTYLPYKAKASAAKLTFKAKENIAEGEHEIGIRFDPNNHQNTRASGIQYVKVGAGGSTILNRLATATGAKINIKKGSCSGNATTASASSSPTPSSSPTASGTVSDTDGDVSGDGKISLSDLSTLFTRFNKKINNTVRGDLNKDGIINVLDYSALRVFMVKKNVIPQ